MVHAVDFANDVEPLLSKFGCNSGGCHGKASGQNGFKLSLLGVDTALDYDALVKQGHGRRVFPAAPERSLLLTKPTGQCAHGGGKRFDVESPAYRLLRRWVEQGMPLGKADSPTVARIDGRAGRADHAVAGPSSNCGSWPRFPTARRKTSRPRRNTAASSPTW